MRIFCFYYCVSVRLSVTKLYKYYASVILIGTANITYIWSILYVVCQFDPIIFGEVIFYFRECDITVSWRMGIWNKWVYKFTTIDDVTYARPRSDIKGQCITCRLTISCIVGF